MLGQRRRRWTNFKSALFHRLVFDGTSVGFTRDRSFIGWFGARIFCLDYIPTVTVTPLPRLALNEGDVCFPLVRGGGLINTLIDVRYC